MLGTPHSQVIKHEKLLLGSNTMQVFTAEKSILEYQSHQTALLQLLLIGLIMP